MHGNRDFVIPVNILTPVCARPVYLGRTTLPCVLIWWRYFGVYSVLKKLELFPRGSVGREAVAIQSTM